ncbi:putative MFS family arabinose efflux permease [Neorhizobium sp. R1-B]|uniref:MFS transporter n=1 Tax=Neorhizobium sp. R1-B TaxID=2485162 RepID=UPI001067051A|nr:MFS transporter [Neorhizobium sp. R1-B]TDX82479.1 putative MFS family arabinose efflux permease [Neorhizobium sp. R1-B]
MMSNTAPPRQSIAIPRTVWVLGVVSLLMDISSEMIQTLLPLYLVAGLGASAIAIGFIEGLSVAIATITKLFSGMISDWTGRRKPLAVLGYGLGALSKPIFPLASSIGWIVVAKAVDRVGKGIRGTPRDALIADVTPPEIRGASFGLRKSLDTVGGFVGPLAAIGLMLATDGDMIVIFWIAAIPAFLAVALLIIGVKEPEQPPSSSKGMPRFRDAGRLNRAVWIVIGVSSLLTLARFSEAFLLLKSQQAGLSLAWIPVTMVVMHAVYGLTAYPVGYLSDRIGRRSMIALSLVFLIAADLALATAQTLPMLFAGIVLWGLHMGFSQGILSTLIADSAPQNLKGTAFGVFNLATGLTVILGNVAAGLLWETWGSASTFLAGAVVALASLAAVPLLSAARQPAQ